MNQKEFATAKETLGRAMKIMESKYGPDHPTTADVLYALGSVCFVENDYDGAEELFTKTRAIKVVALGEDHPDVSRVINRLGTLCVEQNKLEEAEKHFKTALEMRSESTSDFDSFQDE